MNGVLPSAVWAGEDAGRAARKVMTNSTIIDLLRTVQTAPAAVLDPVMIIEVSRLIAMRVNNCAAADGQAF